MAVDPPKKNKPTGRPIRNPSKKKNINESQARSIADAQIWAREFSPDYDQMILRISNAATLTLRCGSPPGRVV